jgi:hypothetical protein
VRATVDVQCSEACSANGWRCELRDDPGHGRGVFDCRDADRPRRMRLTRELDLYCRRSSTEGYGTEPARDTIVDAIGMELRGEARAEGRRGCKDGFAAYDVMAAAGAPPLGIESVR